MDKIRVSKVEDVTLLRHGIRHEGTLHLTSHHLIFSCPAPPETQTPTSKPRKPKEIWITYPMIAFCTYRPAPPASHQAPSIRLRCRDFTFVAFQFLEEGKARDVYESVKSLTCKLGRIEKLYAFSYRPQGPEKAVNGWELYDARREWKRQGISDVTPDRGWRISEINIDYQYSPTYPALLVVPSVISDTTLNYAGKFRSRVRIPTLTYLHPVNNCSITRSSQPLAGLGNKRSVQDEKLVAAIFATSTPDPGSLESSTAASTDGKSISIDGKIAPADAQLSSSINFNGASSTELDGSFVKTEKTEALEDAAIAQAQSGSGQQPSKVYGAQQNNVIIDARPHINAVAMQAIGKGSENMENYKFATRTFLGIDNIHVMRESLNKVVEALKDSDVTPLPPNPQLLAKSGWLKHIHNILDGASTIVRQVGIYHSHVLIHCSDGWDRTSQLSALSQLCLDPYYRTIEGFISLVEKDWLAFGHMFRQRAGLLSSEKWFEIENERVGGQRNSSNSAAFGSAIGGGNAFENALLSAKGFFNKQKNDSRESLAESDGEMQPFDTPPSGMKFGVGGRAIEDKAATKVKETSPVFHQFLDATYQLLYQYPTRFEFNERFLRRLLYHVYSCQYGTFLYDNERERAEARVAEKTRSVWDYFLSRKEEFLNKDYDPTINDKVEGQERIFLPRLNEIRWWAQVFGRTDEEMNGNNDSQQAAGGPVVLEVETAEKTIKLDSTYRSSMDDGTPSRGATGLMAGLASLGIGRASPSPSRQRTPSTAGVETELEVEMQ